MNIKRTALAAIIGAVACGATVTAASAETRWESHHPRQEQVLDRAAHQRAMIRHEVRSGRMSPMKAHRLLVANKRIVMKEHRMAHRSGGYITKGQQHRLNRHESRVGRHIG